jgi:hypothetical protein
MARKQEKAAPALLPVSVASFLAGLPADRCRELGSVRAVILKNLPAGYEEVVSRDMLVYQVPRADYADTYNGQPLWYVALASNTASLSLHLMRTYGDPAQARQLDDAARAAGKTLDRGKACIRFRHADDLPLAAIATIVASTPVERWIAIAKAAGQRTARRAVSKPAAAKSRLRWPPAPG